MENKQYLGDGVYVEHDEQGMLTLSVQNAGEAFEHSIHLEPEVYAALVAYVAHKLRDPKFYTARTKRAVNSGGAL